jgi:hypothetical protein
MCFSAGASFVAGTVLCAAGIVAVKKTRGTSFVLLACIPLLFSIQQFSEGFVWLSLTNIDFITWHRISVFIFLSLAIVVWPVWLPLSFYKIEKSKVRKKLLLFILLFGIALSLYMLYCLIFCKITARVMLLHIYYDIDYTIQLPRFRNLVYIIPTVIPPFISSIKKTKIFGLAIVCSFFLTSVYFRENVVSVWCFFAAIISILILFIVWKQKTVRQENLITTTN